MKRLDTIKQLKEYGLTYKDIRRFDYAMKVFQRGEKELQRRVKSLGLSASLTSITRETLLENLRHGDNFEDVIKRYREEGYEKKKTSIASYEAEYLNNLRGYEFVTPDDLEFFNDSDWRYMSKLIEKIEAYNDLGMYMEAYKLWEAMESFITHVNSRT